MPPDGSSSLPSGDGVGGLKELPLARVLPSIEKWTGWDLNPRPLPCQDSDLPADLPAQWGARKLAGLNRYPHRGDTKGVLDSVRSSILNLSSMLWISSVLTHTARNSRAVLSPVIIGARGRGRWVDE